MYLSRSRCGVIMDHVHVVVTCTKRKRFTPHKSRRLSDVSAKTVEERARRWIDRLSQPKAGGVPLHELYTGEQWHVVRELAKSRTPKRRVSFWVLSAGYGLVPASATVHAYAATFSQRHPESVFDARYGLP